MRMDNKNDKRLFITLLVVLFLLTIGITYAYFSLVVKGNNTANNTVVTAGTLEITYSEGNTINVENIEPGWVSNEKIIYVENTGTLNTNYSLFWEELVNEFENNEFIFDLHCTSSEDNDCSSNDINVTTTNTNNVHSYTHGTDAIIPRIGNHKLIKSNYVLAPGEIHTLKIKFYFKETNENQNYNQGKTLTAKFSVGEYKRPLPVATLDRRWYDKLDTSDMIIQSINFYSDGHVVDNTYDDMTPIDVSVEQENNILLYITESNDCYDVSEYYGNVIVNVDTCYVIDIVGNNGLISFPADSSLLFSDEYRSIRSTSEINFNDSIDTSNVTNMDSLFYLTGSDTTRFTITGLENFDTSNVENMSGMFWGTGSHTTTFDIGNLGSWNTSNVTDMNGVFNASGSNATIWNVGDIGNWDVSNVTTMEDMFNNAGYYATTVDLDLSDWNTSNVENMADMFVNFEYSVETWDVGNIGNWDTSSVTDMSGMFEYAGNNSSTFVMDLSEWITDNVEDMGLMFYQAGYRASTFSLGNISSWNTSNVTTMEEMFNSAGYNATYTLNLSTWNVNNVENHNFFNNNVITQIIPPVWLN